MNERKKFLENIECVDEVIDFEDDDHGSVLMHWKKLKKKYPNDVYKLFFANGGDRKEKIFLRWS